MEPRGAGALQSPNPYLPPPRWGGWGWETTPTRGSAPLHPWIHPLAPLGPVEPLMVLVSRKLHYRGHTHCRAVVLPGNFLGGEPNLEL